MTTYVRTFPINFYSEKNKSGIQGFLFYLITSSLNGRQALWGATITIFIIEICLTIEFFQTIDVNLSIKYLLVLDIFLSIIEIYLSNIHHHELNTNKSINRKIPIILTAKLNRIMLKKCLPFFLTERLWRAPALGNSWQSCWKIPKVLMSPWTAWEKFLRLTHTFLQWGAIFFISL